MSSSSTSDSSTSAPSLSLVPSHIRSHLHYLHQFHQLHTNPNTNTDAFLLQSVRRYQNYLTLLVSSSSSSSSLLLPPLDVALVFHTHLLNPHHFYSHSISIAGSIFSPSFFLSVDENQQILTESQKKWEEQGWKWEAPEVDSNTTMDSSSWSALESYLIPAIHRQRSFTSKMFHRRYTDDQLVRILSKYSKFIEFIGRSGLTAVPTLEIDLAWHTHQLFPRWYIEYTSGVCGFVINHDDSIEKEDLSAGWKSTQSQWKSMFGEDYLPAEPLAILESTNGQCGGKYKSGLISSPSACSAGTCSNCGAGQCKGISAPSACSAGTCSNCGAGQCKGISAPSACSAGTCSNCGAGQCKGISAPSACSAGTCSNCGAGQCKGISALSACSAGTCSNCGAGQCKGQVFNNENGKCGSHCTHRPRQPKPEADGPCRMQTLTQFWLQHLTPAATTV